MFDCSTHIILGGDAQSDELLKLFEKVSFPCPLLNLSLALWPIILPVLILYCNHWSIQLQISGNFWTPQRYLTVFEGNKWVPYPIPDAPVFNDTVVLSAPVYIKSGHDLSSQDREQNFRHQCTAVTSSDNEWYTYNSLFHITLFITVHH